MSLAPISGCFGRERGIIIIFIAMVVIFHLCQREGDSTVSLAIHSSASPPHSPDICLGGAVLINRTKELRRSGLQWHSLVCTLDLLCSLPLHLAFSVRVIFLETFLHSLDHSFSHPPSSNTNRLLCSTPLLSPFWDKFSSYYPYFVIYLTLLILWP